MCTHSYLISMFSWIRLSDSCWPLGCINNETDGVTWMCCGRVEKRVPADKGVLSVEGVLLDEGVWLSKGVPLMEGVGLVEDVLLSECMWLVKGVLLMETGLLMEDGLLTPGVLLKEGVWLVDGVPSSVSECAMGVCWGVKSKLTFPNEDVTVEGLDCVEGMEGKEMEGLGEEEDGDTDGDG